MIYTLTLNPAVDCVVHAKSICAEGINRLDSEELYFGGKGINVSIVLKELGIDSVATGFIAGFTGDAINDTVSSLGIKTSFVRLESGFSRVNIKIRSQGETDLNADGPIIPDSALSLLLKQLAELRDGDTIILSGSVPSSVPKSIYKNILELLRGKEIYSVLDASGEALSLAICESPSLIKPNLSELEELSGRRLCDISSIISCCRELQSSGAREILVSLAENGAVLVPEKGDAIILPAHKGSLVNSVGAGDSMVAGFTAGLTIFNGDRKKALLLATAAGGATAFSPGLAKKEDIMRLFELTPAV